MFTTGENITTVTCCYLLFIVVAQWVNGPRFTKIAKFQLISTIVVASTATLLNYSNGNVIRQELVESIVRITVALQWFPVLVILYTDLVPMLAEGLAFCVASFSVVLFLVFCCLFR